MRNNLYLFLMILSVLIFHSIYSIGITEEGKKNQDTLYQYLHQIKSIGLFIAINKNDLTELGKWSFNNLSKVERSQFNYKVGWYQQGLLFHQQKYAHQKIIKIKTPQEAFIWHFKQFLNDPDYKCKAPQVESFIRQKLNFTPSFSRSCIGNHFVTAPTGKGLYFKSYPFPIYIDPERVYQIQYLFVQEGKRIANFSGHSLFKIIVCSPERKQIGKECLEDEAFHLVAGYGMEYPQPQSIEEQYANTHNSWKQKKRFWQKTLGGITGAYPIKLGISPYLTAKANYLYREKRLLVGIPLKLKPKEVKDFVYQILYNYHMEKSSYYFFFNTFNCATGAMNLLKATTQNKIIHQSYAVKPYTIYKILKKAGLAYDIKQNAKTGPHKNDDYYWQLVDNGIIPPEFIYDQLAYNIVRKHLDEEKRSQLPDLATDYFFDRTLMEKSDDILQAITDTTTLSHQKVMTEFFARFFERHELFYQVNLIQKLDEFFYLATHDLLPKKDRKDEVIKKAQHLVQLLKDYYEALSSFNTPSYSYGIPLANSSFSDLNQKAESLFQSYQEIEKSYLEDFQNVSTVVDEIEKLKKVQELKEIQVKNFMDLLSKTIVTTEGKQL